MYNHNKKQEVSIFYIAAIPNLKKIAKVKKEKEKNLIYAALLAEVSTDFD